MSGLRKVYVQHGGEKKLGTLLKIEKQSSSQGEAVLEDGTLVMINASLTEAIRVDGEFDNAGNPVYVFSLAGNLNVHSNGEPDDRTGHHH